MVKEIKTLVEYFQNINIPQPRYIEFDIRKFEDNMLIIRQQVEPFRHHFFAIALKLAEVVRQPLGFSKTDEHKPGLFFIHIIKSLPGILQIIEQNRKLVDTFFVALEIQNFELLEVVFAEKGRQLNPYVPEGFPKSFDSREAIYITKKNP